MILIAYVSLEHSTKFVSLHQGSQDDLMNIVLSYYVVPLSPCFQQTYDLECQVRPMVKWYNAS